MREKDQDVDLAADLKSEVHQAHEEYDEELEQTLEALSSLPLEQSLGASNREEAQQKAYAVLELIVGLRKTRDGRISAAAEKFERYLMELPVDERDDVRAKMNFIMSMM